MSRLRIVGGTWRGRLIEAPEGRDVTRPTTERTRESMASMVLSAFDLDLSAVRALDAFAGSGALGFEFLSRGAAWCTFCDRDRKAVARIRRNAEALKADPATWRALSGDAFKMCGRAVAGAPFSLVLLDPPYAVEAARVSALVEELAQSGQLAPSAFVLYERAADAPALGITGARSVSSKTRGITSVDLLELGASHE